MEIQAAVSKITKTDSSLKSFKTNSFHTIKNVNVDEILLSYFSKNYSLMEKNIELYEIMFLNKNFIRYEKCFQSLFLKNIKACLLHKMNLYKKME